MKLWSLRKRPSGGKWWVYERDCLPETAERWLKVFQADEPEIIFVLSVKKPKDA